MRKFRIGLMAMSLAVPVVSMAGAGELVPGGWLMQRFMPPAPPPVRPVPPEAESTAPEARPQHTAVHHPPAAPRRREAPTPPPANDGQVRF